MMRVGSIILGLLLACSVLYSEGRLTEEEARTLIEDYKARERAAKEKIAIEMAKIEQLRKEIAALDAEILKLEAKLKELQAKKVPEFKIYKVKKGDTLWGIARRFYGAGVRWRDIYEANKGLIKDPHHILPGWELKIPLP